MDERLIELVQEYEELYDASNRKYNDALYKENIWNRIGIELNKSGNECKQRWASLRDQYRRYLRKIATRGGNEATSKGKFKYADEMSFVKPFLRERESTSSFDDGTYLGGEDVEVKLDDDVAAPPKKPKWTSSLDLPSIGDSFSGSENSNDLKKPIFPPPRKPVKPSETVSSILMKYFVENNKKESKSSDSIDLFFQSIAATVKGFTPYYQIMCKNKVFSVVSELEMTQILEHIQPDASSTDN